MGVAAPISDLDGYPDIYVANDKTETSSQPKERNLQRDPPPA
jgi:hypothetical protein